MELINAYRPEYAFPRGFRRKCFPNARGWAINADNTRAQVWHATDARLFTQHNSPMHARSREAREERPAELPEIPGQHSDRPAWLLLVSRRVTRYRVKPCPFASRAISCRLFSRFHPPRSGSFGHFACRSFHFLLFPFALAPFPRRTTPINGRCTETKGKCLFLLSVQLVCLY